MTSVLNENQYYSRQAEQIGISKVFTPRIDGWASAGVGRYRAFGVGSPTANFTGYQVGANYWFSKRTNVYTIFGSNQTSSDSVNTPVSGNMYALGIKHAF